MKIKVICVGSKNCLRRIFPDVSNVVLDSEIISLSEDVNNLGIVIDKCLSFKKHVAQKLSVAW